MNINDKVRTKPETGVVVEIATIQSLVDGKPQTVTKVKVLYTVGDNGQTRTKEYKMDELELSK
jgi:hypothetical protein